MCETAFEYEAMYLTSIPVSAVILEITNGSLDNWKSTRMFFLIMLPLISSNILSTLCLIHTDKSKQNLKEQKSSQSKHVVFAIKRS